MYIPVHQDRSVGGRGISVIQSFNFDPFLRREATSKAVREAGALEALPSLSVEMMSFRHDEAFRPLFPNLLLAAVYI